VTDTVANIRQVVRDRLEESSARFWGDAQLTRALYEGAQWIARKGEVLQETAYINIVPSQAKYPLPFDGIRVHRATFTPIGTNVQVYPLKPSTLYEADAVWGTFQQQQSSYPQLFVVWGFPPGIAANTVAPNASTNAYWAIQIFPVPAQPGTLTVNYYRQPKALTGSDNDVLEIPAGWEDILVSYCEYVALRIDKDPYWQSAKQEFEEKLEDMIDKTRLWHDQSTFWHREGAYANSNWVWQGADEWW
jgi:hypothetical protein